MTKSWRYSAGWIAQATALAIAQQGASIAFVAPAAEPASREPKHPNLRRIHSPRELVGAYPKLERVKASLRRIASGVISVLALRRTTRCFVFSIPEPLIVTLPLFALLRLSRAEVIYLVHDASPHAWRLVPTLRWLEQTAHKWAYQLSSTIVVLTPTVKDQLVRAFGIANRKVEIIPHGPLLVGEVPEVPGARKLLVFGALRRNKGILEAIKAVVMARAEGCDVQLIVAGEPLREEEGYWDSCLAAMSPDPSGFDIRVGFVADEHLPTLIAGIDAFVLAYREFHSQSGVGVLAALAGRPVIGTRAGGLGELFDLGMAGCQLDGDGSARSIADAIRAFYEPPISYWRLLAKESRGRVSETLDWNNIADAYIAIARRSLHAQ